jgi:pyruvate kinase
VRNTKVIVTLGPSSSDFQTIESLIASGADIVRLNFSHGKQAEHAAWFKQVRDAAERAGRHIPILQDLSGPKIRTGRLENGEPIALAPGTRLVIARGDAVGGPGRVFTTYEPLFGAVRPGARLLLDDGHVELRVESVTASEIETTVVAGSSLGEHKGINAPGVPLPAVGLTEKDERDLAFGLALGVDLVALSFVQSRVDIEGARTLIAREGRPEVPIIAKLERPEALDNLDGILETADGVMVARGDLGLEIPLERVPRVQRDILKRAHQAGVPAILATQVLESMRTSPRPTRAEVSDAANAVAEEADAIMLSGETAAGAYPIRAVEILDKVIREAESEELSEQLEDTPADHTAALCDAAVTLARSAGAAAIVAVTREGRTARLLSMRRPPAPIVAATDRVDVARRLALWWGTVPMLASIDGDTDSVASVVIDTLRKSGRVGAGAPIVVVNVSPGLRPGTGNFLKIRRA